VDPAWKAKMPKVSDLFKLEYGHSLELNALEQSTAKDAVNFVGRAATNNGVTARVSLIPGVKPAKPGTISVALGGQGGAGVAFMQPSPYYCGRDVMVLTPIKQTMTEREKLWWVTCITANRFRFGFGRQANRTLKDLELPAHGGMPKWVKTLDLGATFNGALRKVGSQSTKPPAKAPTEIANGRVPVSEIFSVHMGTNLELVRLTRDPGGINFVSRTAKSNGVTAKVSLIDGIKPTPGGVLSVAGGGSVLETFAQFEPFYSGRDLFYLKPKEKMCPEELLFYAACMRENRSRFSYGRQANRTMKDLLLPSRDAIPSWVYRSMSKVANEMLDTTVI
jgi:hypothetical protein